ncbi:hypothetical protein [[Pseudopropionibacterium] massiliense]|uniref:hypothetical protein n=1 Tax=[Pseudopropionibacterium] massiliense TaxID=2220000 RepID=UPI0010305998|nr:hypothetical protein [[Pseudopropionibacterium] massiliense]
MGELGGLLWVLAIGLPLLALAVWLDVRRRRRLEGKPVQDAIEEEPGYLTQSEIDGLPAPGVRRPVLGAEPRGERLEIGLADPGFADVNGRVDLENAHVLVIEGTGVSMRELMIPIALHRPLVVVARGIDGEVLATLVANRKSLAMPLAAVITDLIPEVADLTGASPVSVADLRAGYLPAEHLGHVTRWVTEGTRTWIEPPPAPVGTT